MGSRDHSEHACAQRISRDLGSERSLLSASPVRRLFARALLLLAAAACSARAATTDGDAPVPRCPPAASDDACQWNERVLQNCANLTTGIYGRAFDVADAETCLGAASIKVTGDDGVPLEVSVRGGFYATPLDAGQYFVCPNPPRGHTVCTQIDIAVGDVRRVDLASFEGGTEWAVAAH
jgi:hypothetical protein